MKINFDDKLLPGKKVSVRNYRCRPAVWEPGTIQFTKLELTIDKKAHPQFTVRLDRETFSQRHGRRSVAGYNPIFVTVGIDHINPIIK